MEKKYITVNGVTKLNPNYVSQTPAPASTIKNPNDALVVTSTMDDVFEVGDLEKARTGKDMTLPEATSSTIDLIQEKAFLEGFNKPATPTQPGTNINLDGGVLLDNLTKIFARHEIPIGLVNKLIPLTEYNINFLVDDSGSMSGSSDVILRDANDYLKSRFASDPQNRFLTRWEEVENRIHIFIDLLQYLPVLPIKISFLNNTRANLTLDHQGKSPEEFGKYAHEMISTFFKQNYPSGMTPLYQRLSETYKLQDDIYQRYLNDARQNKPNLQTPAPTLHYVFTDGEPSEGPSSTVELVKGRKNPERSPTTFLSCTNNDQEVAWLKNLDEDAQFVAELDDFAAEREEVYKKQGGTFPFSYGFWLICNLVASINPDDLDAMDESVPFSKMTLDNLMGRTLSTEEYKKYFDLNPNIQANPSKYASLYQRFATEPKMAKDILGSNASYQSMPNAQAQYNASPNQFIPAPQAQNNAYSMQGAGQPGFFGQQPTQGQPNQGVNYAPMNNSYPMQGAGQQPGFFGQQPNQNQPNQGTQNTPTNNPYLSYQGR